LRRQLRSRRTFGPGTRRREQKPTKNIFAGNRQCSEPGGHDRFGQRRRFPQGRRDSPGRAGSGFADRADDPRGSG
jgi:hypothetical protein